MATAAATCACRWRLLGALTAAAALASWCLASAVSFMKQGQEAFGLSVTAVRVDASEALDKALVSVTAAVGSTGLRVAPFYGIHGQSLMVESGWCDLLAGQERLLHGSLISTQPGGPKERVFLFEVELLGLAKALSRRTYEDAEGPLSLTCEAEVRRPIHFFRSGFTLRRSLRLRRDWHLGNGSLSLGHGFSLSPSSTSPASWPTLANGGVQVRTERQLSLALPPGLGLGLDVDLDLGQRPPKLPPVHIKASVSYAAGPVQLAVSADGPASIRMADGGGHLSLELPILLEANASLPGLMSTIGTGPETQGHELVLRPRNPHSALASLLGQQHRLGLACGQPHCGQATQHLGRAIARALSEGGGGTGRESSSIILHQRLTWDGLTMARVDLAVTGDEQATSLNASLTYRELDALVSQDSNATSLRCLLQVGSDGNGHLLAETQVQQKWSGEEPERQLSPGAFSSTVPVALHFDALSGYANLSARLELREALVVGGSADPAVAAYNTSSDLFTLTATLNLTAENGSVCEARLNGPRVSLSFNWVVEAAASGNASRHELSLTSEPPHRLTERWLAELATATAPAEASSDQRRLFGSGAWFSVIAHHGSDGTCSNATATRFVAQEESFHVGVHDKMRLDGNTSCYDTTFFGIDVVGGIECNPVSKSLTSYVYGFPGTECRAGPGNWFTHDYGVCDWDANGKEFDRMFCAYSLDDLPPGTIVYYRDGRVVDLSTNSAVGKPLPDKGLKDAVGLYTGIKTVVSFEVNKSDYSDFPGIISGELREEKTCRVRRGADFERYQIEDWLPDDFDADNVHCRLCELGDRALVEWEPEAGRKELYDYCIRVRYTRSCCEPTTWEESLNDGFGRFGLEVSSLTDVLGSTSWARDKPLQLRGNMTTNGDSLQLAMSHSNDTFLAVTLDSALSADSPWWFALSASSNWRGLAENASNTRHISGHGSFGHVSNLSDVTGFRVAAGVSSATGSAADLDARIQMESAACSTTRSLQFFTSVRGAGAGAGSDLDLVVETSVLGVATRSSQGLLVAGKADVSAPGYTKVTDGRVILGDNEEMLFCSTSSSSQAFSLQSNLSKGFESGHFEVQYESNGSVVAHGRGPLPRAGHFYVGEVAMNQTEGATSGELTTSSLLVNVSDGFAIKAGSDSDDFAASIWGRIGNSEGGVALLAEALRGSSALSRIQWDAQVTEDVPGSSAQEEWLGSSASLAFPAPTSTTTAPAPPLAEEHFSQTVLLMPLETFAVLGMGSLMQKATAAFGTPMEHKGTACTVEMQYNISANVTLVQAENALRLLTGAPRGSISVLVQAEAQVEALGSAVSTKVLCHALTNDIGQCKGSQILLDNTWAIEAALAMSGVLGTVSVEARAVVTAEIQLIFADPEDLPPLDQLRESLLPDGIAVDSITVGRPEELSRATVLTAACPVAALLVVVQTLRFLA